MLHTNQILHTTWYRLLQQNEGKPDGEPLNSKCSMIEIHKQCTLASMMKPAAAIPPCEAISHEPVETRGLDELINFSNGTDSSGSASQQQLSSKAAKRARQKCRKVPT